MKCDIIILVENQYNRFLEICQEKTRKKKRKREKRRKMMCKYCRNLICLPFCPNSDEPEEAYRGTRCRNCGTLIREGERFYRSHGKPYCQSCVEDASADDLVRFCETTWEKWMSDMGIEAAEMPSTGRIGGPYVR